MTVQEVINRLEIIEDKGTEIFCANLIEFTAKATGKVLASADSTRVFPIKEIIPTTNLIGGGITPRKSVLFGVHPMPVNLSKAETDFTEVEIEQ